MALQQIVPFTLSLRGDGSSTVFTFPIGNTFQIGVGSSLMFPFVQGVVPSAITITTPPVPVASSTIDVNGNISITLVSPMALGEVQNFDVQLVYDSGSAVSISPLPPPATIIYNSSAPNLISGQSVGQQCDSFGNLLVKEVRRSNVIATSATVTNSTSPVVIVPAQGPGIFSDITDLVITPVPGPTVSTAFTITISDGTVNYIFAMETGALTVVAAAAPDLDLDWDPELPATNPNVPWTLTLSSNAVTIYVTCVAIQQKAN
jgi:hypothetical protein